MRFAADITSPMGNQELSASTVLIVDDDVALMEALAELLEHEGYDIATAADGLAALDQLRRGLRPCVILPDFMMRRMNGWDCRREQMKDHELEVARQIRVQNAATCLVALTGYGHASARSMSVEAGFAQHLVKPPAVDTIVAVLDSFAAVGAVQ